MLAPLAASSFRCGACVITLERYLFSKITTTMWSGRGTADLSFVGAGGRTAACGVSVGSIPASRMRNTPASGVGGTPDSRMGSSMALVSVGSVGTTVGRPLEGAGAAVDDGSATAQAADTNSSLQAATANRIVAKPAPAPEKPPPD